MADIPLSEQWQEIMGQHFWKGLLDPMNPLLRIELIKYGEFCQATGDGFNSDRYSTKYGQPRYPEESFFDGSPLMPKQGYDVTMFTYMSSKETSWPWNMDRPVNPNWTQTDVWAGYVAVSNEETTKKLGRRDVCIVWRGTVTGTEWAEDINFRPRNISDYGLTSPDRDVKAHEGFLNLYTEEGTNSTSARKQVLTEVKRLINEVYPTEELSITVTGHSLGAALALLNGYDILETGTNVRLSDQKQVHVCMMTFAGPRVGNWNFAGRVEALKMKVLRVVNGPDIVPDLPPAGLILRYKHVGEHLDLNSGDSPYLKPIPGIAGAHNLEGYLHLVDGYQGKDIGKGEDFVLANNRDIALVNKESGLLQDEHHVPESWKIDENKGMIKNAKGLWVHT